MHEQFIEPTMRYADIIIPSFRVNEVAVELMRTVIRKRLDN
jgi:uridine kinase